MTEPRRLKDQIGFDATLLRSAEADRPNESARRALEIALALAPLPVIGAASSASAATAASGIATSGTAGTLAAGTGATTAVGGAGAAGVALPVVAAKVGMSVAAKAVAVLALTAAGTSAVVVTERMQDAPASRAAVVESAHRAPSPVREHVPPPDREPSSSVETVEPSPTLEPSPTVEVAVAPASQPSRSVDVIATNAPRSRNRRHAAKAASEGAHVASEVTPAQPHVESSERAADRIPDVEQEKPATPVPARPGLADEVALLDRAVAALRRHDAHGALSTLDAYERAFPRGSLAPEAAFTRIEATLAAGDRTRARALAQTFLAGHGSSPLARRVRVLFADLP